MRGRDGGKRGAGAARPMCDGGREVLAPFVTAVLVSLIDGRPVWRHWLGSVGDTRAIGGAR